MGHKDSSLMPGPAEIMVTWISLIHLPNPVLLILLGLSQENWQYEVKKSCWYSEVSRWFSQFLGNGIPVNKVNSSPSSAAYIRRWTRSALVQVMAWRLFGTKLLPYCQFGSREQISVKFEFEFYHFHLKNAFEIVVCQDGGHFVQGGDELILESSCEFEVWSIL